MAVRQTEMVGGGILGLEVLAALLLLMSVSQTEMIGEGIFVLEELAAYVAGEGRLRQMHTLYVGLHIALKQWKSRKLKEIFHPWLSK